MPPGPPAATLQRLLLEAAADERSGLAFYARDGRRPLASFGEIAGRAARVAGALARRGVRPGDRVALVFPTAPGFFDAFFGALLAGAVPVPLYPPVRLGRLDEYHERTARQLAAVEAALVVADPRLVALLGRGVARALPRLGVAALAELSGAAPLTLTGRPEELALVQFSSGTTVEPKPVALDHRALLYQARSLNALWPERDGRRSTGVSWLPLYHDMGLIGCVLPAVEMPTVLTLLPPELFVARPALWLRAISETRAAVSPAPNFAYALATERVRDEELEGVDLSCWRVALCGAETVVAGTLARFAERFARWGFRADALTPVYGLSEAALAVTFPPLGRGVRARRYARAALAGPGVALPDADGVEIVSVGAPLPGFALEVRDAAGRVRPERHVGRIHVSGPSLLREYLGRPEATAAALADGWLDTGDLGFLDDGELYLAGRAKDALIVNGRNHSPAEVELAVDALPGVRRGCVAAVSHRPEEAPTERLLLFVERHRDAAPAADAALAERCRAAVLAASGLDVDRVVVLEPGTLPRTSSGKIRRHETLRRHLAGSLAAPARVGRLGLAGELVRGRVALARARRRRALGADR
jgi:acyl-CoA synthetase (AMP-forming)/AMP-acid ligase II